MFRYALPRLAFAIALSACIGAPTSVFGQGQHPWDLAIAGQTGQATTYMVKPFGGFCGLPVELGDFDNDGFVDYAIAPMNASSGPANNRQEAGEIIVIKGNGVVGGVIDMANPPVGQPLMVIYGGAAFDYAGTEMYSADVTGDGILDLLIASSGANAPSRTNAGAVYIIPGGANFTSAQSPIDLATPPAFVTKIVGRDATDRLGIWVEAGDFDGDGIDDLMTGADDGNGPANADTDRGEVWIIYGGQALPPSIDLLMPPVGIAMTVIYGVDNNDHFGTTLHSVDLDNDGYEEMIGAAAINRAGAANTGTAVAGGDGPGNSRPDCGETYIVWGRAGRPASIDLANPDPLTAASLTTIYGADVQDSCGEELSSGDFDGDGTPDLALGALTSSGYLNQFFYGGEAVIIYGGAQLRGQTIDMATPPAGTVTIYGSGVFDIAGDTLSSGDVNKDGYDDLLIAIPESDPAKPTGVVSDAGEVVVFFGGPVRWPQSILLDSVPLDIPSRSLWGGEPGDLLGYSMECGDFNADGWDEIFPNSMRGDGMLNLFTDAGETNIVDGRLFSRGLVTLQDAPVVGSTFAFNVRAEPFQTYFAAFSTGMAPGFPVPGIGTVYLANDFLLSLSTNPSPYFSNMIAVLDAEGRGQYQMTVPAVPGLSGYTIFTSFVTLNGLGQVTAVADTLGVVLL